MRALGGVVGSIGAALHVRSTLVSLGHARAGAVALVARAAAVAGGRAVGDTAAARLIAFVVRAAGVFAIPGLHRRTARQHHVQRVDPLDLELRRAAVGRGAEQQAEARRLGHVEVRVGAGVFDLIALEGDDRVHLHGARIAADVDVGEVVAVRVEDERRADGAIDVVRRPEVELGHARDVHARVLEQRRQGHAAAGHGVVGAIAERGIGGGHRAHALKLLERVFLVDDEMLIGIVMQVGRRVFLVVRLDLDGALRVVIVPHLPAGGVLRVDRRAARHRGAAMARSAGAVNRRDAVPRRTEQARILVDSGDGVARVPRDVSDIAGLRGDGAVFRRVRLGGARCRVHHVDQSVELSHSRGQVLLKNVRARQRLPIGARDADTGHVTRIGLPGHLDADRAGKGRTALRVRCGSGRYRHDAVAYRGQHAAGRDGGDGRVGHRPADVALVRHARTVVPPGHVVEPQRAALRGDALGDGRARAGGDADRGTRFV